MTCCNTCAALQHSAACSLQPVALCCDDIELMCGASLLLGRTVCRRLPSRAVFATFVLCLQHVALPLQHGALCLQHCVPWLQHLALCLQHFVLWRSTLHHLAVATCGNTVRCNVRRAAATIATQRRVSPRTAPGNSHLDRGRCRHRRQELRRQQQHPQCRLSREVLVRWMSAICRRNLGEWSSLSHEAWPGNEEQKDSWWTADGGDQGEGCLVTADGGDQGGMSLSGRGTWGSTELGGVPEEATKGACYCGEDMGIT